MLMLGGEWDFSQHTVAEYPNVVFYGKPTKPDRQDVQSLAREIRFEYPEVSEETAALAAAKELGVKIEIVHVKKGTICRGGHGNPDNIPVGCYGYDI